MTPYVWAAVTLRAAPQSSPRSHQAPSQPPHGFIKCAEAGEVLQLLFSTPKMDRDPLDKYDSWPVF